MAAGVLLLAQRGESPRPPAAVRHVSAAVASVEGSSAAWTGRVIAVTRWLAPPEGHLSENACALLQRDLVCPDLATCDAILDSAWTAEDARAALRLDRRCDALGCTLRLPGPRLAALSREARGALTMRLGAWERNSFQAMPLSRLGDDPPFAETPGIDPSARAALRALTWGDGFDAISHPAALCDLGLPAESLRGALRALWTAPAKEFSVAISRPAEVASIARYWSWGRDPEGLRLRLEAAFWAGHERVEATELLPPEVSHRMNAFARASDDEHNCLNAALCADDPTCPPRLMNDDANRRLRLHFERVATTDALRAGDVLVWRRANGTILHAAAWLADDLVLTKNGSSHLSPWIVAPLARVQRTYRTAQSLEFWRRKSLPVAAGRPVASAAALGGPA